MTPDDFITRMTVLYGPPDTIDNEMFLDEYRAVLVGNDGKILKRAGDIIRDTQVRRFWPTPAEVKEAIRKAAATGIGAPHRPAEHVPFEPAKPKSDEEIAAEEASRARVDLLAKSVIKMMRAGQVEEQRETINSDRDVFESMQRFSPNRFHRG